MKQEVEKQQTMKKILSQKSHRKSVSKLGEQCSHIIDKIKWEFNAIYLDLEMWRLLDTLLGKSSFSEVAMTTMIGVD